jgi:deoxyribose-phosphate aldolase
MRNGAIDEARLESILTEVATQLVERGEEATDLGALGCTSIHVQVCPENVRTVLEAGACRVAVRGANASSLSTLGAKIDHTLLKPDATADQVDVLCGEAMTHKFASVCVNGGWVRRCAEILRGSGVLVCTVVGFPLGACLPEVKAYEARRAIEEGACEVDMVLNVGALKSGDDELVRRDIAGLADVCHRLGARLKVILETCLLTDEEKVRACLLSKAAGADFVKTSTGFSSGGATLDDVALMRRTVGPAMGVKASGGVRDNHGAQAMIEAGATRLGASASIAIVGGTADSSGGY